MGLISSKLRSMTNKHGEKAIAYYCPGCKDVHLVWYEAKIAWEWNGDIEKPTIHPSIRIYVPAKTEAGVAVPEKTLCHCYIRDGNIQFLSDCAHSLAEQNVPIPNWPYLNGTYGGIDEV